jgi:hypothetical protein
MTLTASCAAGKIRLSGGCIATGNTTPNGGSILAGGYLSGTQDWICNWAYTDPNFTHQAQAICTP